LQCEQHCEERFYNLPGVSDRKANQRSSLEALESMSPCLCKTSGKSNKSLTKKTWVGWCQVVTLSLPPTTMANLKVFFFLLGDSSPSNNMFPIIASPSISVGELKDMVYALVQDSVHVKGIGARNLILWKVLLLCSFPLIMS
jgi:hypothetical protein